MIQTKQLKNPQTHTSQWLNASCGFAKPLVLLRNSSTAPKLSMTGKTAVISKTEEPSIKSSLNMRPPRFPSTAYNLPASKNVKICLKYQATIPNRELQLLLGYDRCTWPPSVAAADSGKLFGIHF
jgi:hypothetical protein